MGKKRAKALPDELLALIAEKKADTAPERVKQLKKRLQTVSAKEDREKRWPDEFQKRYEKTKNPLAAWDCYSYSRKKNAPIPEFVLSYLDRVAKGLLNPDNDIKAVPLCLEFNAQKRGGGHGDFRQYADFLQKREAVFQVYQTMEYEPGLTIEKVCDKVAAAFPRLMVTGETIKKWKSQIKW